jgi:hypothetical protein
MNGTPRTGASGFGTPGKTLCKRVPNPPARTIAWFIR